MISVLISTTEFVKLIWKTQPTNNSFNSWYNKSLRLINRYANFISQKPTFELLLKYIKNSRVENDALIIITSFKNEVGFTEEYLETMNSLEELIIDNKLEVNDLFLNKIIKLK